MSLRSRLDRLEKQTGLRDGRCPGCGFRPHDVRTIEICSTEPGPGAVPPPFPNPPDRPRCPVCGGWEAFVFLYEDGSWEAPREKQSGRWDKPAVTEGLDP